MIHQYKMGDLSIVLDIHSGSVHVVDEISYDLIEQITLGKNKEEAIAALGNQYDPLAMDTAYGEIQELKEAGMLFSEDDYKEAVIDFKNRSTVVKALCLHVAHDCNLKCRYCFAGEGEYHGDRSLMSYEVGQKALDFLVANSGNRVNLEVDFFGGEPLMNWDVVKDLVIYGRSIEAANNKKFRFTLTTNGVLLNEENMAFMNEHMHNVVLSLDGRPEVNDHMRPTANGKGSYDLIMPKFKEFAESRGQENYYLRGTFTHNNLDFAEDVLHMADQGFKQISVEPVVSPADMSYALQEEDIPQLMEQYEILAMKKLDYAKEGKDFNFFHFMIDLTQGPCVAKRLAGCGSGVEYLAVTPEGDLYPCHQYVGIDEFLMGNVDTGITNDAKQSEFKCCNVYAKDGCTDCWAKFYCSGGCSANAYNFHNDILATYEIGCDLERKRVECAIFIKAKEMLEENDEV